MIAILFALNIISCVEDEKKQSEMEVSKTTLSFDSEGGTDSVQVLNYNYWWIVETDTSYYNTKKYTYSFDTLTTDWYQAVVPKTELNKLRITVDKNTSGNERKARIHMTVGNVYQEITITQE